MQKHTIFIAGAGGIGKAAALILANDDRLKYHIILGDVNKTTLEAAKKYVINGTAVDVIIDVHIMDGGDEEALETLMPSVDVILDCLPGKFAPKMARLAKAYHCHYANLTEYVAETNEIIDIAKDADTCFVLQTGLAPGFINILGMKLLSTLQQRYSMESIDHLEMKVGALSTYAVSPHYYAFTWSTVGVATEYVKDSVILKNGEVISVKALSDPKTLNIDGVVYEDNFTSGGAADLPHALKGIVKNVDYKTLRYPGHYAWVAKQLEDIGHGPHTIKVLEDRMKSQIPHVEDDVVVVYAAVQGVDKDGLVRRTEKAYHIEPSMVGNHKLKAIQTTTAAPLCQMAYLMITQQWKGLKLQSKIDPDLFLAGHFVKKVYGA